MASTSSSEATTTAVCSIMMFSLLFYFISERLAPSFDRRLVSAAKGRLLRESLHFGLERLRLQTPNEQDGYVIGSDGGHDKGIVFLPSEANI